MEWKNEQDRILNAYERMHQQWLQTRHFFTYNDPAHFFRLQERYWNTLALLKSKNLGDLGKLNILDVGCGDGWMLRELLQWGARPGKLVGIELREEPVKYALALNPNLDIRCGSATELPWSDAVFDLVCQHTVFTSILDVEMKRQIATEMIRVLKPGGALLWYDFAYNNPSNPDVRGVKAAEIRALFPNLTLHLQKITLAPPIARRIPVNFLPIFYPLLSAIPFLRTHYLGLFIKDRNI